MGVACFFTLISPDFVIELKMEKTMKTTLLKAFDNENKGRPQNIFLFSCTYDDSKIANGLQLKEALGAAFRDWYVKTKEGRLYVDENGVNWGDATCIPDGFLKKHGIRAYDCPIRRFDDSGDRAPAGFTMRHEINLKFDDDMIVDHNDDLFDIGEADEVAPDLLAVEVETEEEGVRA